ncbi:response regulator transcription factor [Streptomyces pinistramenti]|uniref:response regulator transcription factor n=1 Tax=Streptomyces pinistramenti TaxID=2884812 RepID=UPI001D089BC6|nr:response regulator transcription factor [Streptomyces pinistramenti]MCB5906099.1 response regulator transcription factor [Streptomyces pinistramenti]
MPTGDIHAHVLVVDDDEDVRTLARWQLESEGFHVLTAADGQAALEAVETGQPDVVLLDLTLPLVAGLDVLTQIRRRSAGLPVIVVSGRSGETDRIIGLDLGADDYVVKPFSPAELAARVRSVLRRSKRTEHAPAAPQNPRPGLPGPRHPQEDLMIDRATRTVTVRGSAVELTAREFDLLAFLADSPRHVYTRDQLLEHVWQSSSDWQEPATVTQHVHRLRRKVERDPDRPRWLRTVRGVGYRFEP